MRGRYAFGAMGTVIGLGLLGVVLTVVMLLQRHFISTAVAWLSIVAGLALEDPAGSLLLALGAIVLLVGSVGLTRGAIFAGSPRRRGHEPDPSIFTDDVHKALADPAKHQNEDDGLKMDSPMFTHPFWGPE